MSTTTRWIIDPAHSSAEFRVPNFWGLVKVPGHFDRIDGWLEVDENGSRRLELIIAAASVNTGNRQRDEHLRSADFFDIERHPEVQFVSSQVSDVDDGHLHVRGDLLGAGGPKLKRHPQMEIDASAMVDQRQLGMTWSPLGIAQNPDGAHGARAPMPPAMSATRIDRPHRSRPGPVHARR